MSDGWKYAYGQTNVNEGSTMQGSIFDPKNNGDSLGLQKKKMTAQEYRDWKWSCLDSYDIFKKDEEDQNIAEIKSRLKEMIKKGESNNIKIGEMTINIDTKHPDRITFSSIGKMSFYERGYGVKCPYAITICGDDMYSEVEVINDDLALGLAAECKGEPIRVSQIVTIINGGRVKDDGGISEEFKISRNFFGRGRYADKGNDLHSIVEEIVENNPEYKSGGHLTIYRDYIDPTDEIRTFQSRKGTNSEIEGVYPTDLKTVYETKDDYSNNSRNFRAIDIGKEFDSYGDGIPVAKDIEDHCRYIYSLFVKAQNELKKGKATGEDGDGTPSNPDDFDDPERIRTINKKDKANEVNELISQKRKLDEEIDRYTNKGGVDEEIDKEEGGIR